MVNKYLCAFCVMLADPELDSEFIVIEAEAMVDAASAFIEQRYPSWMKELTDKVGANVVLVIDVTGSARIYTFDTVDFGQGLRAIPRGWVISGDVDGILTTPDAARANAALASISRR